MNGFHVHWPEPVRRDLLRFITQTLSGTGRATEELNRALTVIEEALERRPTLAGESRVGNERVIFEPPICVGYVVDLAARRVTVRFAHYSRGKRK